MSDPTRRDVIQAVGAAVAALYVAPAIETVLTAEELTKEIDYAGAGGSCPPIHGYTGGPVCVERK